MAVTLTVQELGQRIIHVQSLLKPLAKDKLIPCCFVANPSIRGRIVSGHSGGSEHTDHRALWFQTFAKNVQGQYFEIWYPRKGEDVWVLERAYLAIRKMDRSLRTDRELLCIHCDPVATDDEPVKSYKRGPHLHIVVAEAPFCDAHLPLNLCHLKQILGSVRSLTKAYSSAIKIVCNEIIEKL